MRLVTVFLCVCLAATASNGKGKGKGKGDQGKAMGAQSQVYVVFDPNDVRVLRQYYSGQPVNLPPGLRKNLARGKPLPPGWQKKLQPFPRDLDVRLGPVCGYCGRGVIDGYGVVYDKKTAVILDVLQLVGDIVR